MPPPPPHSSIWATHIVRQGPWSLHGSLYGSMPFSNRTCLINFNGSHWKGNISFWKKKKLYCPPTSLQLFIFPTCFRRSSERWCRFKGLKVQSCALVRHGQRGDGGAAQESLFGGWFGGQRPHSWDGPLADREGLNRGDGRLPECFAGPNIGTNQPLNSHIPSVRAHFFH